VLAEDGPERLLAEALGPRLRVLPDNCCGLSGTFGFKEKWYEVAQAIGRPQFEAVEAAGAAEVATPCGSCQHQLGTSTRRPARHPAVYLARALGVVSDRRN
jgi:glycerol-3-phosphate dehydrogenase subunit C